MWKGEGSEKKSFIQHYNVTSKWRTFVNITFNVCEEPRKLSHRNTAEALCVQEIVLHFPNSDKTLWLALKNICSKYQHFYLFSGEEVHNYISKADQPVL